MDGRDKPGHDGGERGAPSTLRIADRVYVLEHGRTVREGTAQAIAEDRYIQQIYLGV